MTQDKTNALRQKLGEISDVGSAMSLLRWDQETMMPPKGGPARGMQLATLSGIHHRLQTDPALGSLLEDLLDQQDKLSEDDAALVREAHRDFDRATRLPEDFVKEFAQATSNAFDAWQKARKDSDFPAFRPHLEKIVDLNRRKAGYFGYEGSPYNALLEEFERGMTAEQLRTIFTPLAQQQRDLIQRIVSSPNQPEFPWLDQKWTRQGQWDLSIRVLEEMGYDLDAGRQDESAHPFTTNFDIHDVRVTTRIAEDLPFSCLMAAMHEGGHALYEQGFLETDRRTPLAEAPSLGIHESQSRLWENQIGRSLPFCRRLLPTMRQFFPGRLDDITPEDLYRAVNQVQPSLIRVEADECTYNLHVIIRFEIEVDLIEKKLEANDVPEKWNALYKQYLGVDVPNDAQGCLQDVHWSFGAMGYFPTYTLGNLYCSQIFETILGDLPTLWEDVENGNMKPLLEWLRAGIHRIGRRRVAPDIVRAVTGKEPGSEAYIRYLESKFGELYSL